MNKKGFASMYIVYSFFLVFITMMFTTMLINNYKCSLLNALKNDIKESTQNYHLKNSLEEPKNNEESTFTA